MVCYLTDMSLHYKNMTIAGWGNFPKQACAVFRPEKQREIQSILSEHSSSIIARGAGKSYGDAALNWEGVVSLERLNRILAFDIQKGVITAQAGVTLKEIIDIVVPQGWFVPVLPGTKYVTLGGAFAANVHGKNACRLGEFAKHVLEIKLRTPHQYIICSQEIEPKIFWATAGGMGMTGVIEEVTLQLMPIASASLQKETFRTRNIADMLEAFRQRAKTAHYMVGWVDHFATGSKFGQGIFESAVHQDGVSGVPMKDAKPSPAPKPFPGGSFMLNSLSMKFYNARRFGKYTSAPKLEKSSFDEFFHPLDKYSDWNKLYGPKGFLQYQFIIPEGNDVAAQIQHILQLIQNAGQFSYLAVIKCHAAHEGLMSFSMKGFSVALDFANTKKVHELLKQLDEEILKYGGRVYLAKDARMSAETFQRMYASQLSEWRQILQSIDPERKINSAIARRLHFRGAGG